MPRRSQVDDVDLGWKRIQAEIREAKRLEIQVGIPAEDDTLTEDGVPLVLVAAVNEFGNDHIPSRPALRNAFDEGRGDISRTVDRLLDGIYQGKLTAGRAAELLGQTHRDAQVRSIIALSDPENAQSTIDAKGGKTNPLVNTGQYHQSITYAVRSK